MEQFKLTVNNNTVQVADAQPQTTLLNWLRSRGLTGSKEGCAEGECGACAVLLARPDETGGTRWESVNACLLLLPALSGAEIVTSEGLGTPEALHPVQHELAVRGGSQCGYCTPGFVVSMAAEYYRAERQAGQHHAPNGFDIHALSGNLCRCTGYRPIQEAAYALGQPAHADPLAQKRSEATALPAPLRVATAEAVFERPNALPEALALLAQQPDAKILAGGTDWGVEVNLRHARASLTLAVDALPELRELKRSAQWIEIGAGLSLSEIERQLAGQIPLLDQLFPRFASRLIRNSATLGGNLGTASPIGDSPPALLALGASLRLTSLEGEREVPLSEYFTGYRQTVLRSGELIRSVKIPLPLPSHTAFHKIAKRRFDDISSVALAFALDLVENRVQRIRIGLGGVAATPVRAYEVEDMLTGKDWNEANVDAAARLLAQAGTPLDDHRASAQYRAAMLGQALRRFYAEGFAPTSLQEGRA